MYLVRYDRYTVIAGKFADLSECFPVPYPSDRVMRVAEKHKCRLRFGQCLFEPVKINAVPAVPVIKRILLHISAVVSDTVVENIVHRRHYKHILGRSRQLSHTA